MNPEKNENIRSADDFLLSPEGMTLLDATCRKVRKDKLKSDECAECFL